MRLDIRKATVAETLIDLGARMGVSMGGVEACKGKATPLSGQFTLREALDRVIRDRGCAYAFVDSRTIRFTAFVNQLKDANRTIRTYDKPSLLVALKIQLELLNLTKLF